ncbi:MAG: DtxR family Mn-dependent transcriptional regulator [Sphingobacteriales bacterium]|jgi:DtxR family Mn-dependent transcriptional regulator
MHTFSEENYLKSIFKISRETKTEVKTNEIAADLNTRAASVTDMLKKLAEKNLIEYVKYQGVSLSPKGTEIAVDIVRKHRLWECFLVDKLGFSWDEVHSVAEDLEHINSPKLINRLDKFLGYPKYDPHGDPIPDEDGNILPRKGVSLFDLKLGESGTVVGVKEDSTDFLRYLEKIELILGAKLTLKNKHEFDQSIEVTLSSGKSTTVSRLIAENLFIKRN